MSTYRVDLAGGEVEEISPEEELERIQARLRNLAMKINQADEGPEKSALRKQYRERLARLRELGGDAPVRESYVGDDLTAAVDDIVADFTGTENPHAAVDLAEAGELPQDDTTPSGRYFGVEEFMKIAAEEDAPASEDAELHEALRQQAEADRFGGNDSDATDEELWNEFKGSWGIEESA